MPLREAVTTHSPVGSSKAHFPDLRPSGTSERQVFERKPGQMLSKGALDVGSGRPAEGLPRSIRLRIGSRDRAEMTPTDGETYEG